MAFKPFSKLYLTVSSFSKPEDIMRVVNQLQSNIEQAIFPLITEKTQNDSQILKEISLVTGQDNVVAHKLGRKLAGWKLVRIRGNAVVYDSQDNNDFPQFNLILNTTADVVVDIEVF